MIKFIFILFTLGLFASAIIAKNNTPKWNTKMMLISSSIMLISSFVIVAASYDYDYDYEYIIIILVLSCIMLIATLLYIIGLLSYAIKTFTANKANKELEYLNYQIKDQLEIRAQKNASSLKQ